MFNKFYFHKFQKKNIFMHNFQDLVEKSQI